MVNKLPGKTGVQLQGTRFEAVVSMLSWANWPPWEAAYAP